jgi:lia operon protein LiaG
MPEGAIGRAVASNLVSPVTREDHMNALPLRTLPRRSLAVLAFTVAFGGALAGPARAERYTLAGDEVAIYNLAGEVRLEPTRGSEVVVEVTLGGADAEELEVETGPLGELQALRVVYPGDRVVYPAIGRGSNTSLRVRENGVFGDDASSARGRRVQIVGSGRGVEAHADLRVLVPAGRQVRIRLGAGEVAASDVQGDLDVDAGMGAVSCHGTRGALALDTGSGSIRVSETQGDVDLDTGSGNVDLTDARGGAVRIDTGSGSVRLERVRAEVLDVDTGSGNVTLAGIDAPRVTIDTGSGAVRLDASARLENCDVDTGSGSVTLALDPGVDARFELETGSGGIDVELPHTVSRRGDGFVRGRFGEGAGFLKVDTGSGSVRIVRGG